MKSYGIKEIVEELLIKKRITKGELCRRTGMSQVLLSRILNTGNPTMKSITKILNGLGVEICIIDGWRKYRLNDYIGNVDIDTMLESMKEFSGGFEQREDRWQKQKEGEEERKREREERIKEKAKERYLEKKKDAEWVERNRESAKERYGRERREILEEKGCVCERCERWDERLERERYGVRMCWCEGSKRYEARVCCKYFIGKVEE